jgi:hypothetical protein
MILCLILLSSFERSLDIMIMLLSIHFSKMAEARPAKKALAYPKKIRNKNSRMYIR